MKALLVTVSKSLVEPAKEYQAARRYLTFSQAVNELIRVGLETTEKKEEKKNG